MTMAMNQDDLIRMNKVLRHRLRNLASGIKAAIAFLSRDLEGQISASQKEYFPLINAECDSLSEITARLNLLFEVASVGSAGTVGDVLERLGATLRQRFPTAMFKVEVDDDDPRGLRVDSCQGLLVALEEVMVNAIEETPRKDVVLRCLRKSGKLVFEVEDEGPGVNPPDTDRVFLPFYTTKPRHLGLGLAIAKKRVSAMGGKIRVDSRKPAGLRVSISLSPGGGMAPSGDSGALLGEIPVAD